MGSRSAADVSVRFSVQDAEVVRQALEALGKDGDAALRRIDAAGQQPSRGLAAMSAVMGDLRGQVTGLGSSLGIASTGLLALGPYGIAAAAAIGAVTFGLSQVSDRAKIFGQFARDVRDNAAAAGLSATQYQGLSLQLQQFGVDQDKASTALVRFAVHREEAAHGSGALYDALKQQNAELAREFALAGSTERAINVFAQALVNATDKERAFLANAAFGRGGALLAQGFIDLAGKGGIGAVIDALTTAGKVTDEQLIQKQAAAAAAAILRAQATERAWNQAAAGIYSKWKDIKKDVLGLDPNNELKIALRIAATIEGGDSATIVRMVLALAGQQIGAVPVPAFAGVGAALQLAGGTASPSFTQQVAQVGRDTVSQIVAGAEAALTTVADDPSLISKVASWASWLVGRAVGASMLTTGSEILGGLSWHNAGNKVRKDLAGGEIPEGSMADFYGLFSYLRREMEKREASTDAAKKAGEVSPDVVSSLVASIGEPLKHFLDRLLGAGSDGSNISPEFRSAILAARGETYGPIQPYGPPEPYGPPQPTSEEQKTSLQLNVRAQRERLGLLGSLAPDADRLNLKRDELELERRTKVGEGGDQPGITDGQAKQINDRDAMEQSLRREQERVSLLGDIATASERAKVKNDALDLSVVNGAKIRADEATQIKASNLAKEQAADLAKREQLGIADEQEIVAIKLQQLDVEGRLFKSAEERANAEKIVRKEALNSANAIKARASDTPSLTKLSQDADLLGKNLDENLAGALRGVGQEFSLLNTSTDTFGKKLQNLSLRIADAALQAVLMKTVIKPLADLVGGGLSSILSGGTSIGGGGGSRFTQGNNIAEALGDAFDRRGVVRFARGGIFDRPTMFAMGGGVGVLGEAGPEAIMPLARGPDGHLGVRGGGGGSTTIHQHFYLDGAMTKSDVVSMVKQGAAAAMGHTDSSIKQYDRQLPARMSDIQRDNF